MQDDEIQEAPLRVIEVAGRWNAFDGPAITSDLRTHRTLWRTAMLVGPPTEVFLDAETHDLIRANHDYSAHRGIPDVLYGFDTLQLTPAIGLEDALESLARKWGADDQRWIGLPRAASALDFEDEAAYVRAGGDPRRVLLELWWD
ncbi:MAG: hypothetical protein AB1714_15755 [Acidobacteriota bacterium]